MIKILSIGETYIKKGIHSVNNISYTGGISHNPMETYNYIIKYRPDIIVFATQPGNLENLKVYQRIRNMYAGKFIPIILLVHEEDEDIYEDLYEDAITVGLSTHIKEEILFLHIKQLVDRCNEMKKNVLIVDKDPVTLNTYRLFLEERYQIHTATSTNEAVNYLMSETVSVIIFAISEKTSMDIKFIQFLQDNQAWRNIPIIVQIEANQTDLVPKILDKGIIDCLIKPIGKETLLERLSYALSEEKYPTRIIVPGKKRVLLIDKLGINCRSIRSILEGHYESVHVLPGVRAISILEVDHIDGIILNLDNGLFCLNKIMEKALIKHIPIILYTSNIEEINKVLDEKTKDASCIHSILELPVSRTILLDKLELAI